MTNSIFNSTDLARVLEDLACPACYGALRLEPEQLVCVQCRRDFPIVDGIPVLILDQAGAPTPFSDGDKTAAR